ncbi:hypothetical protein QN277_009076 [Acacia crassicarpa]|uniref:Thaumatin-like protein n=1 Tax=Acacia crassicarpa TaxID=499986 RepID=A0AAE1MB70_9FABA|nr:hypothetical protein QN277_009076 [Acacia crassicarpa]
MIVLNKSLLEFSFFVAISLSFSHGVRFDVTNRCPYTVWAAAVPSGGQQLNPGETWILNVAAGTTGSRIWGRTNCNFDGSGHGKCQTGDCGGLLECKDYGTPPNTLCRICPEPNIGFGLF